MPLSAVSTCETHSAAYDSSAPIPVGTIVVKTSVLDEHGAPGSVAGPIFVMEKRAAGYAPDANDWWYALHWAAPPADEVSPAAAADWLAMPAVPASELFDPLQSTTRAAATAGKAMAWFSGTLR